MKIVIKVNAYVHRTYWLQVQQKQLRYKKNNEIYEAIFNVKTNQCDVSYD